MLALQSAFVAYVIPVKRLSIVFGVIFGHFIFKEKHIKERFIGAAIMLIGIFLIAMA